MTDLDKALVITGVGTMAVGILMAGSTVYTETVWSWIDSIVVLLLVGLILTTGSRLFGNPGAVSGPK
ncbi:hypothetical protein ACLI4Y_17970 [Natrialbaceae archaeon A-CW3]